MHRSSIRAIRVGSSISSEVDRGGAPAARQHIEYWCASDHRTTTLFAEKADVPVSWDCDTCGDPALQERGAALPAERTATFFRTPYEFLMMRRTPEDGEELLAEALANLARRRSRTGS